MTWDIREGDVLEQLRLMPDNEFSAVLTDPPYGLSDKAPDALKLLTAWLDGETYADKSKDFTGKDWQLPGPHVWREVYRVLKPGGTALVFAGARTADLMGLSLRLAGFELKPMLAWVFASGMPHGLNIGKALRQNEGEPWHDRHSELKPALEPILVAVKPLEGTYVQNALKHGVAGFNIADTRTYYMPDSDKVSATPGGVCTSKPAGDSHLPDAGRNLERVVFERPPQRGRFTSNLILSDTVTDAFDEQAGVRSSGQEPEGGLTRNVDKHRNVYSSYDGRGTFKNVLYGDSGGASRFFKVVQSDLPTYFCAKVSRAERDTGLGAGGNTHVCVKPLDLTRYLSLLVRPPQGVKGKLLIPYSGSGSEMLGGVLAGWDEVVGIELEPEYTEIAHRRLEWWNRNAELLDETEPAKVLKGGKKLEAKAAKAKAKNPQTTLFDDAA